MQRIDQEYALAKAMWEKQNPLGTVIGYLRDNSPDHPFYHLFENLNYQEPVVGKTKKKDEEPKKMDEPKKESTPKKNDAPVQAQDEIVKAIIDAMPKERAIQPQFTQPTTLPPNNTDQTPKEGPKAASKKTPGMDYNAPIQSTKDIVSDVKRDANLNRIYGKQYNLDDDKSDDINIQTPQGIVDSVVSGISSQAPFKVTPANPTQMGTPYDSIIAEVAKTPEEAEKLRRFAMEMGGISA